MSLAEVQNKTGIRAHQMKRVAELETIAAACAERADQDRASAIMHDRFAMDHRARAHALRVQLDLEDSTKRYQEQTK